MKKIKRADFVILAVLLAVIIGITLIVMSGGKNGSNTSAEPTEASSAASESKPLTLADYDGKNIGVQTGTTFDEMVKEKLPKANISYFNSYTDLLSALKAGTIDAFATDEPIVKNMMIEESQVDYLNDYMNDYSFGFAFPKNDEGKALCDEFSEYIKQIKSDGTLKSIDSLWFGKDESIKDIPDLKSLSGKKGKLSLALESLAAPFVYVRDGEVVGYEVDIAYRFCKEKGYGLEIADMNFDGIIPAISGGKNDFGCSAITITDERKESVNFSESHYDGGAVIAVRKEDIKSDLSSASSPVKVSDYNGKKIGILTGTNMEKESFTHFPDSEYLYFDGYPNLNTALLNGSIDAFLGDEAALKNIHAKQPEIDYIKERLVHNKYSFAFRKDDEKEKQLCDQFNEFLAKGNANGTIAELDSIWFGSDDSKKVVDLSDLKDTNGTIHVITTTTDEPFSYIKDGKNVGYDIDVIAHFCREYGYALEIGDVDFNARIPALASGKYEFTTSMNVTPEREEEVMFSDPVSEGGIVCAVRAEDLSKSEAPNEPDYTDYIGKRVGIQTGSSFESMTFEKFPDSEYLYFDTFSDLITALANDKIDGFMANEPNIKMASMQQENISYLKKPLMEDNYCFGFQKNTERSNKLRTQFNELLAELKSSGELDNLNEKWFANDDDIQIIDDSGLTGENGEIVVAISPDNLPFAYVSDNELKGLSVDFITLFAQKYGYTVKYEYGNTAACIAGITSGKYDILAGSLSVTEERKKSMDFSDVVYNGGVMLAVRSSDLTDTASISDADSSWLSTIKDSFEKNFIREDRYKLVLQGIGTTCLITLLTVIFGSILAFLICMFRRLNSLLAGKIANLYVRLLQGTPIVVLLMILYYVVFGNTGISAIWVAVIGFSLNFAAYVSEILRSGIESIDTGQREAALALGFSENQSFFRFIFPQAAIRQLPVYRGEVISLLKSTSIVGYIAIQDLTKMSDIIRSRTYEAFFPLIATAVIYFIIGWIITLILNIVLKQIDPRSKKRRKKGAAKK